jgi:hypothetical protein
MSVCVDVCMYVVVITLKDLLLPNSFLVTLVWIKQKIFRIVGQCTNY